MPANGFPFSIRISGDTDEGNVLHAVIHHNTCPGQGLHGRWNIFYDEDPTVARNHRLISFIALLLLAWTGLLGRGARDVRVRFYPWLALVCGVGSAIFGHR